MSNSKNPYSLVGDCIVKDTPDNVVVRFPSAMFYVGVGDDVLAQRTRSMENWVALLNWVYNDGYNQKDI
jgi:hypothetical protein